MDGKGRRVVRKCVCGCVCISRGRVCMHVGACVMGSMTPHVNGVLCAELGVSMTKKEMKMNIRCVLKMMFSRFFGPSTGFVDMLRDHVPSPVDNAETKIRHTYTGDLDEALAQDMLTCNADGALMLHVTKLYPNDEGTVFKAFGRVLSGTIHNNSNVRVLGETYSLEDDEDSKNEIVTRLFVSEARYAIEISRAPAGCWVLIEGGLCIAGVGVLLVHSGRWTHWTWPQAIIDARFKAIVWCLPMYRPPNGMFVKS